MLRVTLDTITEKTRLKLQAACAAAGIAAEFKHTTVTDRETEGTSYATSVARVGVGAHPISETATLGESRLDGMVVADDDAPSLLEEILKVIIGHGSFPSGEQRENLSEGHRHQFRDAMILQAHTRERRDVFVTNDVKAFIRHGRREALQKLCSTRIMTLDEFRAFVSSKPPTGGGGTAIA